METASPPIRNTRFGPSPSRRDALRIGALTAFGLGTIDWLRLRAQTDAAGPRPRARSAILIWLDGGPSHLDTFDPKPDAPAEVRGPFRSIATRVPGLRLCEHLPHCAAVIDKLAIVRSMTSPLGEHNLGSHYVLTGFRPSPALVYPSYGSVVAHFADTARALPPYINVGSRPSPMAGSGYLPPSANPFVVEGDPARAEFRVRDLDLYPEVTPPRLERRRGFLSALDGFSRLVETSPDTGATTGYEQAYRLIHSRDAREAFDLSREPSALRQAYGPRSLGQSCLLARRLVERGVPFVTVTDTGWDTHTDLVLGLEEGYKGGKAGKLFALDSALATLVRDLDDRGLLDETLVLVLGEFGRTPKVNSSGGRDHWPRVFSVALAGAGIRGGQAIGTSDEHGESPADRPLTPADLARTVFTLLGIDPDRELATADGRPVPVSQHGEVIAELAG